MTIVSSRPMSSQASRSFHSVARSHVGRVRKINEDRIFDSADMGCWAVADGMGGHCGGDIAAQTVVDHLRELARSNVATPADMASALDRANAAIHQRNRALRVDAGSTVVAAIVDGGSISVAWAGDSRAYRIRGGIVTQLTHDHSVVQELVDAGLLTIEAAERHPQAHVITRALGVNAAADLAVITDDLLAGDRLLLCSDGLSRSLKHGDLSNGEPIDAVADRLLSAALTEDGSDNISLVLVEIE